jgi:hypothetical protein
MRIAAYTRLCATVAAASAAGMPNTKTASAIATAKA